MSGGFDFEMPYFIVDLPQLLRARWTGELKISLPNPLKKLEFLVIIAKDVHKSIFFDFSKLIYLNIFVLSLLS